MKKKPQVLTHTEFEQLKKCFTRFIKVVMALFVTIFNEFDSRNLNENIAPIPRIYLQGRLYWSWYWGWNKSNLINNSFQRLIFNQLPTVIYPHLFTKKDLNWKLNIELKHPLRQKREGKKVGRVVHSSLWWQTMTHWRQEH